MQNKIAIFKDRIEIWNPGEFPEGLTPQDFISGKEKSYPRNPLIADVLYKSKDIEKWGSGLKRIYDECKAKDVKVKFELLKRGYQVVFYRPEKAAVEKTVEKTVEQIISLIRENPKITQKELSEKTGLTRRGVEWNLQQLKQKKLLKRIGPDKGGYWEVMK